MTDLHCHILPALDDGSPDAATSLMMAEMAADSGTGQIVCTPHCTAGDPGMATRMRRIRGAADLMNQILARERIQLQLFPGMEVLCTDRLAEDLADRRLLTLADSRYLLIEFDFDATDGYMWDCIQTVQQAGLVPVVAHPERYFAIQDDPSPVAAWFRAGCVIQVNKGSVLGRFGPRPAQTVDHLLEQGLAHVVASDAHGTRSRTTVLSEVRDVLARRYSPTYADVLLLRNPRRIVMDRALLRPDEI